MNVPLQLQRLRVRLLNRTLKSSAQSGLAQLSPDQAGSLLACLEVLQWLLAVVVRARHGEQLKAEVSSAELAKLRAAALTAMMDPFLLAGLLNELSRLSAQLQQPSLLGHIKDARAQLNWALSVEGRRCLHNALDRVNAQMAQLGMSAIEMLESDRAGQKAA